MRCGFVAQRVAALLHNEGQLRFTMRRSFATVCRDAMRGACPTTAILFVFPLKGGAPYMGGRSGRWGQKLSNLHLATCSLQLVACSLWKPFVYIDVDIATPYKLFGDQEYPLSLLIFIDYQCLPMILLQISRIFLIFIDFLWFSLIFFDFYWFSLIFIDFHWFLLIFIDFHWFSLIFIDFL